jgi:ATP-dependent exoDNAse (exonuclease V) beta subunit
LGSLVHAALATVDLARPGGLRAMVERHAERLLLAGATEVREALQMIEAFVASPRAREVSQARQAHAEVEFLLAWPLDGQDDSQVVLGGFIDRLYQDRQGAWHVLDFKTNRTDAATLTASAAPYELQMLVYGLATEQIMGQAPASLKLHFLRTGDEYAFAWDADARRRTIELVNQAIADDVARSRQRWLAADTYRARQGVL